LDAAEEVLDTTDHDRDSFRCLVSQVPGAMMQNLFSGVISNIITVVRNLLKVPASRMTFVRKLRMSEKVPRKAVPRWMTLL
jgi:hypothetical protein